MRVGHFAKFADGSFPRELRCLDPRITASGYRAFVDDALIPSAQRMQPDYTVFTYVGGFPKDPNAALELDDVDLAIRAGLNVSWDELSLARQDYEEAIGHNPGVYMGSLRAWYQNRQAVYKSFVSHCDDLRAIMLDLIDVGFNTFVWDEAGTYRLGTPEGALLAVAMEADNTWHMGEPRQTRGSMASVSRNLPCLCLGDKWRSSGGVFGDNDHVPLANLIVAGCTVDIIDTGESFEEFAGMMRKGVGVALGTTTTFNGPALKKRALEIGT